MEDENESKLKVLEEMDIKSSKIQRRFDTIVKWIHTDGKIQEMIMMLNDDFDKSKEVEKAVLHILHENENIVLKSHQFYGKIRQFLKGVKEGEPISDYTMNTEDDGDNSGDKDDNSGDEDKKVSKIEEGNLEEQSNGKQDDRNNDDDENQVCYTINCAENHGLAFILSYGQFESDSISLEFRSSSLIDIDIMKGILKQYGFLVQTCHNETRQKTLDFLKNKVIEEWETGKYDILIGVLSSHGDEVVEAGTKRQKHEVRHRVICSDGEAIDTYEDIVSKFDTLKNKGKPKLYFIQACRSRFNSGDEAKDLGVSLSVSETSGNDKNQQQKMRGQDTADTRGIRPPPEKGQDTADTRGIEPPPAEGQVRNNDESNASVAELEPEPEQEIHEIFPPPCTLDSLVMFASASGKFAFARDGSGGWLVRLVKQALESQKEKNIELTLLLTEYVSYKMALEMETINDNDKEKSGLKCVPCIMHMLRKDILLRPLTSEKTKK